MVVQMMWGTSYYEYDPVWNLKYILGQLASSTPCVAVSILEILVSMLAWSELVWLFLLELDITNFSAPV